MPDGVKFLAAPNPAHGPAEVFFSVDTPAYVRYQVFDLLGQAVRSSDLGHFEVGQYRQPLGLQGLAPGSYFVVLVMEESSVKREIRTFKVAWLP